MVTMEGYGSNGRCMVTMEGYGINGRCMVAMEDTIEGVW